MEELSVDSFLADFGQAMADVSQGSPRRGKPVTLTDHFVLKKPYMGRKRRVIGKYVFNSDNNGNINNNNQLQFELI